MSGELSLNGAIIQRYVTPQVFQRGEQYFADGMVLDISRRGDLILAEAQGSEEAPYEVSVERRGDDIAEAGCTCPDEWEGYCNHVVAVLLTRVHLPETVLEKQSLEELLAPLEREQLASILLRLLRQRPSLACQVEEWLRPPAHGRRRAAG